jgi:hypothetical protein
VRKAVERIIRRTKTSLVDVKQTIIKKIRQTVIELREIDALRNAARIILLPLDRVVIMPEHQSGLTKLIVWGPRLAILVFMLMWGISTVWEFRWFEGGYFLNIYSGRIRCELLSGSELQIREFMYSKGALVGPSLGYAKALFHYPFVSLGEVTFAKEAKIIEFPFWIPILLSALILSLLRYKRRRYQFAVIDAPFCQSCGYSLVGNVSGICPECGTQVRIYETGTE